MYFVNSPFQSYLDVSADVKDSLGIETQRLTVRDKCGMAPRIPRTAVTFNSALPESVYHLGQSHVEIACKEFDAIFPDPRCEAIPKRIKNLGPFHLHGSVMPMNTQHIDFFANMADVLSERNFASHHARSG